MFDARERLMAARRALRLTPYFVMARELKRRGFDLSQSRALEMFGGTGLRTVDLEKNVKQLEVWELNPEYEQSLRTHLPNAKIKIVDSFQEIQKITHEFDLISADAYMQDMGPYTDHFQLFPFILDALDDDAVLILNITTNWNVEKIKHSGAYTPQHLARRREFYACEDPLDVSLETMMNTYERILREHGWELTWWFTRDRYFLYPLLSFRHKWRLRYLVLKVARHDKNTVKIGTSHAHAS